MYEIVPKAIFTKAGQTRHTLPFFGKSNKMMLQNFQRVGEREKNARSSLVVNDLMF